MRYVSLLVLAQLTLAQSLGAVPLAQGDVQVEPANATAVGCKRVQFEEPPSWLAGSAWATSPRLSFYAVDALRSNVLEYSLEGKLLQRLWNFPKQPVKVFRPSLLQALPDGKYLLEFEDGLVARLNRNLVPVETIDLYNHKNASGSAVGGVFSWSWSQKGEADDDGSGELLALADVEHLDGTWESGFFTIPLRDPARFQRIAPMAISDPARQLYLLGYPYLTTVAGQGFILKLGATSGLVAVDLEDRRVRSLKAFPDSYRQVSLLSQPDSFPAGPVELYGALESATMPSGLYGDGDSLYVLTRRPGGEKEGTEWTLYQIDIKTEKLVGTFVLPTRAPHISITVGRPWWGIVEKQHVEGLGSQKIDSLVLVPRSWLRGSASPLAPTAGAKPVCQ